MRREEELAVDKASLVAQQVAIVEESRAEVRKGLPNHLASVKFNEDDMVACAEMMEAEPFRSMRLPPMIGAPSTAPEAPRAEERRLIEESAAGLKMEATPLVSWWCKCLCQNRERFEDVAIGAESADADKFFLVLFAKKQPFCVTFLELRRVPVQTLCADPVGEGPHDDLPPADRAEFAWMAPLRLLNEDDLPFTDDDDLFVRTSLRFEGELVAGNSAAQRFEYFIAPHPRGGAARNTSAAPRSKPLHADARAALLAEYPWLDGSDLPEHRRLGRHRAPGEQDREPLDDTGCDDDPEVEPQAGDVDVPAPLADATDFDHEALGAIRASYAWDDSEESYFYVHVMGGAWTQANKGVCADGAGGFARKGVATHWCKQYNWPRQASFQFSKYGREACVQLSREYCRRSHHVCSVVEQY